MDSIKKIYKNKMLHYGISLRCCFFCVELMPSDLLLFLRLLYYKMLFIIKKTTEQRPAMSKLK